MKAAIVSGAVIAALAASALATPTFAQDYYGYGRSACQETQHDRGTAGAVIGGLLGAVIGSNVAPHAGNRAGGAAIGAVAGALLGNSIGRSSAKSSDRCDVAYNGYYDQGYGYAPDAYRYRSDYGRYDHDRYDSRYGYRGR